MRRPSLLTLMLVPILLTITVGLAGFGVYIDRIETQNRLADIDDELVRASTALDARTLPAPDGDLPDPGLGQPSAPPTAPADTDTIDPPIEIVLDSGGDVVRVGSAGNPFDQRELSEFATQRGTTTSDDGDFRVLLTDAPDGGRTLTALPLDGFNAAVADFRRALIAGGLVVIALEALVIVLVARSVSRPVVRMTDTATRVANGELDTAVGRSSGSRETAQLADDLEQMLDRLRSTLDASEMSASDARTARDQMERFLGDVSHEFRTPLTALHGYSDLHAKGMLDDDGIERAMTRMGSESARLNALVDDMMQLARKGSAHTEPELFDTAAIVTDVVDDLRSAHPDRTIDCLVTADAETHVVGVPGQIHQAVLNLGANACGHSDDSIAIELTADDTHVEISVIDHGPGIDEADRERIFQPFVRLDASRTRTGTAGAGLGLALTNQIAAAHRGTVRVSDTPGGGATVTIRLPRATVADSVEV